MAASDADVGDREFILVSIHAHEHAHADGQQREHHPQPGGHRFCAHEQQAAGQESDEEQCLEGLAGAALHGDNGTALAGDCHLTRSSPTRARSGGRYACHRRIAVPRPSALKDSVRPALRILLSSYVTNGVAAASGLLLISALVHLLLGAAAAAAATVGVIVVTPPDTPSPRRGKFTHFLPAVLIGTPLFFATGALRHSVPALGALLVGASFVAFLGAAWGKRGLPVSVSVMFAMVFALASPAGADTAQVLQETLAFALGACLYVLWGTAVNMLLNGRYRVLALADALHAVTRLMRAQGLHFTMDRHAQQRTA